MSRTNAARYWRNEEVVSESDRHALDIEALVCWNFISWMRSQGAEGWWAASEIDELLEVYCDKQGVEPPPRDRARKLLAKLPGISRERRRLTGPAFARLAKATGLSRATVYWIPPSTPVQGPWGDRI